MALGREPGRSRCTTAARELKRAGSSGACRLSNTAGSMLEVPRNIFFTPQAYPATSGGSKEPRQAPSYRSCKKNSPLLYTVQQQLRGTVTVSFTSVVSQRMSYTLAAAATATGLSKTTILKAIKNGQIIGTKDELGEWHVEPADLHLLDASVAPDGADSDEVGQ